MPQLAGSVLEMIVKSWELRVKFFAGQKMGLITNTRLLEENFGGNFDKVMTKVGHDGTQMARIERKKCKV